MNEPANLPSPDHCPGCHKATEPKWFVCPHCGLRLKPTDDLMKRSLMWLGILSTFILAQVVVAQRDRDLAWGFSFLVGLPLAYVFGKAVLFRLMGRPLTWSQLGRTSVRTVVTTFVLVVVVPIAIGLALLIFLFIVCSGSAPNFGH